MAMMYNQQKALLMNPYTMGRFMGGIGSQNPGIYG